MKRIVVTGGAGFIGSNYVRYKLGISPEVHILVLDKMTYAGNRESLADLEDNAQFEFVHGDIRDQSLVEKLLHDKKLDTVVHLAAESHVDRSILGPDTFIETNIIGTHSLLKAAKNIWGKKNYTDCRFHHVSTDEVYGSLQPDAAPFTEAHPSRPNSPYAASKAAADHLVRAYHQTYGLPVTISNCSNNYGPYQFPEKLIPLFLINALHGKPLPIYGDGLQVRDWLHVAVHCEALYKILERGEIVSTRGRNPQDVDRYNATKGDLADAKPVIVLINGGPASAAEIVAAALQDRGRAVVVGTNSFGKGTVQNITRLPNDGELIITWSRLYAPSGYSLHGRGVLPTVWTADEASSTADIMERLRHGRLNSAVLLASWRTATDDQTVEELRQSCPGSERTPESDLELAAKLFEDMPLLARALELSAPALASP